MTTHDPRSRGAIDACVAAGAGGGMVYLPPGKYTSGTLHLRSYVRMHLEAGAPLYSSKDRAAFDKRHILSTISNHAQQLHPRK